MLACRPAGCQDCLASGARCGRLPAHGL